MPLIELSELSFSYPQSRKPALDRITLSIASGEYLALVGPNGSGKSSLLRILAGLERPSSGSIRFGSSASSGAASRDTAAALPPVLAVGLVFQSPADQIVSSSVEEDVAFGPENLGLPRAEIRKRVDAALAAVGLAEKARSASQFLSAGQQQRLAVAGALASDAPCIAFDEATAMLDPEARETVLALMDELVASGRTVIHVTHDMDEVERASRVLSLDSGSIVFDGSPAALFASPPAACGLPSAARVARSLGLPAVHRESPDSLALRIALRAADARGAGAASKPLRADPAFEPRREAPAFELREVGHSYLRGSLSETRALEDVSLAIPRGCLVAFVGRTGSGKSTALQLLDGLVSPSSGAAVSFGRDLSEPKADLRAVRMNAPLAVQRPETALFERYAADDVAFGPRNLGLSGKALVERVRAAMEETGLDYGEYRDRLCRALSGGEKRRLALAGVLAMGGEGLLLDEPTCALDPATKEAVRALIARRSGAGVTVVMATHSMEEAASADLVAVFDRGRLAAFCDPETLFYDRFDPAWGIARPFAVALSLALEERGLALRPRPLSIAQLSRALAPGFVAAAEALS